MASQKINFTQKGMALAKDFAKVVEGFDEWVTMYFDLGYDAAGGDVLEDADIAGLNRDKAKVADLVTLGQQAKNFRDNLAVTQGDYGASLNKMRDDY